MFSRAISPLVLVVVLGCQTSTDSTGTDGTTATDGLGTTDTATNTNGTPTDTDGTGGGTSTGDTASTGTVSLPLYPKPTTIDATCVQSPNALRFTCTVNVDPPQPVQVTFARSDGLGPTRVHTSEFVEGTHDVPLYFMGPNQDYNVEVAAIEWATDPVYSTIVHTGNPPFDFGSNLTIDGTSSVPLIGTENPCDDTAIAVIYDTSTGTLVWYQNLDPEGSLGLLDMVRFTEDKTILGETDAALSEMDLLGNQIAKFDVLGFGFLGPHHDVYKWNNQYYFLHQYYPTPTLTLDAFVVFDSSGTEIAHWYPDDVLTIPAGASGDYFHTNTVYVDSNGDVFLNYLTQETFIKIEGDISSPDFGQPIWVMSPANQGAIGNDFVVDWSKVGGADSIGFQHNLHLTHDGRLMVLDNANGRGLVFTVDEVAKTATVDAEYETHENNCGPQGTAMDTSAGNVFVGCNTEWLREFDGKTGLQIWEAELECRNGGGGGFFGGTDPTRWYPLEGW